MSSDSSDESASALREVLRTVTPPTGGHPDAAMDTFGWGIFLGLVVLLLPMLPFIAIVWLISKLTGRAVDRVGE